MKYINSLEATVKNYSNSELDVMYRILLDATCESFNMCHGELYDNPIHRTLERYWTMIRDEKDRRNTKQQ